MRERKSLKIIGILSAFIIGISYNSLSSVNHNEKSFSSLKSNKTNIQELIYKTVKIGSSNLCIKLPYVLTSSNFNQPQENLDKLTKSEVFFFLKDKTFQGKISYSVYNKDVEFSVEKGTNGGIANIKALPGVEKVDEKRDYFKKDLYEGCIYEAIVYRYGKSFEIKGATIKCGQETWAVIITYLNHTDKYIADRIVNSLK